MRNLKTKFNTLRRSDGFTIIEIMIVLAIAGVIMLIVLLAVPALQRNSRNTTIKSSAASVAGGISTFASDNNGTAPNVFTFTSPTLTMGNAATACTGSPTTTQTVTLSGSIKVNCITAVPAAQVPASTLDVWPGEACPASQPAGQVAPTAGTASANATAIYYSTETTSGLVDQCTST